MARTSGGKLQRGVHFDMINDKQLQNEPGSGEFSAPTTRQDVGKSNQHLLRRVPA